MPNSKVCRKLKHKDAPALTCSAKKAPTTSAQSRPKQYCSNPLGPKHAKAPVNKSFALVTEKLISETRELIPNLNAGDHLCRTCNLRIYKFVQNLPEEQGDGGVSDVNSAGGSCEDLTDCDDNASSGHNSDKSGNEDEFFEPATDKKALATILTSMNVPAEELQQRYVTATTARNVYQRVKARVQDIKKRLEKVVGSRTELSPRKIVAQEIPGCQNCEHLLQELITRFQSLTTKEDKYRVLTTTPPGLTIKQLVHHFGCSIYMPRKASNLRRTVGVYSFPIRKHRQGLGEGTITKVIAFYESDDNSRADPSQRNAVYIRDRITGMRELRAKRVLWPTLHELHREFLLQYPEERISVSALAKLRPENVIWSGQNGFHNSCTCVIHENFGLLMSACGIDDNLDTLLGKMYCHIDNDECMLGICKNCPNTEILDSYLTSLEPETISFSYWGNSPGCVGFQLLDNNLDTDEFRQKLLESLPQIAAHHFVARKQKEFINSLKRDVIVNENVAVLQVDFAQNYSFIVQNAVAGHHWSNCQATVVPFVLIWFCRKTQMVRKKAFVVISDELGHNASTFFAFRVAVMDIIAQEGLKFEALHIISDGAASQFKNWKNILNLRHHLKDFGIKAYWHFFATSHGESECDAAGATVKRACRLGSLKLNPATKRQTNLRNSAEMAEFASKKLTSESMQIVYVTAKMVQSTLEKFRIENRYERAEKIPGIRLLHSFVPESDNQMTVRRYSSAITKRVLTFEFACHQLNCSYFDGQYVAVQVVNSFAVGKIVSQSDDEDISSIQLMKEAGEGIYHWPEVVNVQEFSTYDIIIKLTAPQVSDSDQNMFTLNPSDLSFLKAKLIQSLSMFANKSRVLNPINYFPRIN